MTKKEATKIIDGIVSNAVGFAANMATGNKELAQESIDVAWADAEMLVNTIAELSRKANAWDRRKKTRGV